MHGTTIKMHGTTIKMHGTTIKNARYNNKKIDTFSKNSRISDFMKIRPVGAELLHVDRRTDSHNEGNSPFL
jgi:hypothetical protein